MSPVSIVPFVLAGDNCMCQQSVLHMPSQIVCGLVMSEHSFLIYLHGAPFLLWHSLVTHAWDNMPRKANASLGRVRTTQGNQWDVPFAVVSCKYYMLVWEAHSSCFVPMFLLQHSRGLFLVLELNNYI
jgi:hypothetical protein